MWIVLRVVIGGSRWFWVVVEGFYVVLGWFEVVLGCFWLCLDGSWVIMGCSGEVIGSSGWLWVVLHPSVPVLAPSVLFKTHCGSHVKNLLSSGFA